ncbi:PilZ domain-containing protein [Candidatus Galacturonibacter soehngenii]|uniref:PilZ domain-containing protein n=1 Tax=Candidatus Galacturonatibacter soehngenii TaxID=2307010 RepID=A0A7V7QM20_9FIRM|nr:PilZ domain-containing protein [Candidatus Galacturonibacter soehngenii]KAB1439508.1 PilZ domain-containing protein [Candidatus Galacturonibacter soehngenii]MBA4687022.1 PilZ domain-containing protein [Candidatus Galacturonibacter soehngenii]
MMEKRKCKRSVLNATIQLRQCNGEEHKKLSVDVTNLSREGLGFFTSNELQIGDYYDTEIEIWTKEVIKVVIKIVRKTKNPDKNVISYGGEFIGLSENEKFRIDVYQCVEENVV